MKYRSMNATMFLCFLDASNAFDWVNHAKLFQKLVDRGVLGYFRFRQITLVSDITSNYKKMKY